MNSLKFIWVLLKITCGIQFEIDLNITYLEINYSSISYV